MNRNSDFIPVTITASIDLPSFWGRFARLSPDDADLSSQFRLAQGGELSLSFELAGRDFGEIRARIVRALRDRDGYYAYFLVFSDPAQSEALRSALIEAFP